MAGGSGVGAGRRGLSDGELDSPHLHQAHDVRLNAAIGGIMHSRVASTSDVHGQLHLPALPSSNWVRVGIEWRRIAVARKVLCWPASKSGSAGVPIFPTNAWLVRVETRTCPTSLGYTFGGRLASLVKVWPKFRDTWARQPNPCAVASLTIVADGQDLSAATCLLPRVAKVNIRHKVGWRRSTANRYGTPLVGGTTSHR